MYNKDQDILKLSVDIERFTDTFTITVQKRLQQNNKITTFDNLNNIYFNYNTKNGEKKLCRPYFSRRKVI